MPDQLLETKFHSPPWRKGGVMRPRLLEKLQAGFDEQRRLTLISAPPGYGKTSLVSSWLQSANMQADIAWLSIERGENDPARFLGYWAHAIQRIVDVDVDYIQSLLALAQLPPMQTILDLTINALATHGEQAVLILDDYHTISNPLIHEALDYFLEHQPAQAHLLLITREDPPLPLARLRARGQMVEIRASDLRFTSEETSQFFKQSMHLNLQQDIVSALEARTEGWAVGLQLAALAVQNLTNLETFLETFHGSHRYVLDYLAEEVVRRQEDGIRQFLVKTSVLENFNSEICEALTGYGDCQGLLERLEQANLFLIPLDDERVWYRYHHLFADFLRSELSKAETVDLQKKAAAWHEQHDLVYEAVQYARDSGDSELVADVVDRALRNNRIWSGGNLALYLSWLKALTPQSLQNRPQLSLNASRVRYLSGRFDLAADHIKQAEADLSVIPAAPERDQLLAIAALYRGSIAAVRGEVAEAIKSITSAQAHLSQENQLAHARGFFGLGLAYELSGQTELAIQNYRLSSARALAAGVLFLATHALCAEAQVHILRGQLNRAEQACRKAIQLTEHKRLAPLGLAWSILGGIALERNDLSDAEAHLSEGIELSRQGGLSDDLILGLSYFARLYVYQDQADKALEAIQEVRSIIEGYGVERMSLLGSAYLAQLQLLTGQKAAARQWATAYSANRGTLTIEFADLTMVRVLLMTGDTEDVTSILKMRLDAAQDEARTRSRIEILTLMARCELKQQNLPAAVDHLAEALRLAAPEGFSRLFLDEGAELIALLPKARPAAPEFVDAILNSQQTKSGSSPSAFADLPDPLSEQEFRVLKLIAAGKSNKEIAEALFISVGTAKWHAHNIFQKLGVNNRPQAIALANERGII